MIPDSEGFAEIGRAVETAFGIRLLIGERREQGGGCINAAWMVPGSNGEGEAVPVFLKANSAGKLAMFEAESEALAEMAKTETIRVPQPIACGLAGSASWLALEGIAMQSLGNVESQREMGRQLAALHRVSSSDGRFGWHRDNVIGETPQPNGWKENWIEFFREQRLGHQFRLAENRGRHFRGADALLESLPGFFERYDPAPSLLHGDLWGGNAAFDEAGNPVIFDPATYYGDRETDLAFTELFGGFGSAFHAGYDEAWPRDSGYPRRKTLYNLYHILNHDHLFGGGYGTQAQGMIDRLLGA